jgi:methyl-accepting chemotaxis protein
MDRFWTFGRKLGLGFAVTVAFAIVIGVVAILTLVSVRDSKDRVISVNAQNLIDAAKMNAAMEGRVASTRGFLLTKDESSVERSNASRTEFMEALARLKTHAYAEEGKRALPRIERFEEEHQAAWTRVIDLRRTSPTLEPVIKVYDEELQPKRLALDRELDEFVRSEERLLTKESDASTESASRAMILIVATGLAALVFATVVAFILTRTLARQIGTAIQHVQSSSSELQAAANQQSTGAKEQATAMNEITTTISELLATSRQIAESARRVSQMAEQNAQAARTGDAIVVKGQDAIGGIKRQVDLVVNHMLDLGRKAQQIGGILEIINELAEQTNILAINATIEAAGAGESGKRFAVVADEIRKLADRVAVSTKEIRGLIDETRAAVNTTVMATESGSKAVDQGTRQFAEVAGAFKQIADQVKTTTEAAREIELSTKQQSTAVEQVNAAIADVAQTTKETEASSNQTFQTATQLTHLSRDLSRFVQPQMSA